MGAILSLKVRDGAALLSVMSEVNCRAMRLQTGDGVTKKC